MLKLRILPLVLITVGGLLPAACFKLSKESNNDLGFSLLQARDEAAQLATTKPSWKGRAALYENCEALQADLAPTLHSSWIEQKLRISENIAGMGGLGKAIPPVVMNESRTASSAGEAVDAAAPAPTNTSTASPDGFTNVQEKGADESDHFKIGEEQIFSLAFGSLQVVDRRSLALVGAVSTQDLSEPQIYTLGKRLILIGQTGGEPAAVKVRVYSSAAGALPTLVSEVSYGGSLLNSRLLADKLVLVVREPLTYEEVPVTLADFANEDWIQNEKARALFQSQYPYLTRPKAVKIQDGKVQDLRCTEIAQRNSDDWDLSLTKTYALPVGETAGAVQSLGVIGGADEIYVTASRLYLLKTQQQWFSSSMLGRPEIAMSNQGFNELAFLQLGLESDQLKLLGQGQIPGRIKDRWSIQEKNNGQNLLVVSSTGQQWGQNPEDLAQNHLIVLTRNAETKAFSESAGVHNFGTRETVRAVRFSGNFTYVVTFRQTDPLFAFDTSDLAAPRLLSGLKVLGFSSYLHPLDANSLLGVGYDATATGQIQGLQVSLFDVSNPLDMLPLDQIQLGDQGSWTDVTSDPRAFFYDQASQLIGVPVVEFMSDGPYSQGLGFTGAIIFERKEAKLLEKARITHKEWIPSNCLTLGQGSLSQDINRIFRVDDRLLTLSRYGIKAFTLDNLLTPTQNVHWAIAATRCAEESMGKPIPL